MDKQYFDIWSSLGEMERDYGVSYVTAQAWHRRGEIPRSYDLLTMQIVERRGFSVSVEALDEWHRKCAIHRAKIRRIEKGIEAGPAPVVPSHPFRKTQVASA